jgi:diguanylate cyclase (GGDEF)-like protein
MVGTRPSDFVGRYGGEEFLILLSDTGKEQARTLAEKVRAAVAAVAHSKMEQPVTASIGVATVPDDASDPDALIRAADRALYAAKGKGSQQNPNLFSADREGDRQAEHPT